MEKQIYAMTGANNNWNTLNKFECYNPEANTWTALLNKEETTSGSVCEAVDGKLYVIGGYGAGAVSAKAESFNPGFPSRKWYSQGKVGKCLFDKQVSFNDITYPANVPFNPNAVGSMAFSQNGTSGSLMESYEDLELSAL
ncbi:MAG: hypothetical protein LBJ01_10405 [Tannerella sp.]|jgi:hypothetical protein|nr:hypothetical protein [Tannerella sp.]